MNFWKTEELAQQIKDGEITEEIRKNYYIATSVVSTAAMYLAMAGGVQNGMATLAESIIVLVVTILSINIIFKSNKGNDGIDFIARVVMLGLPILIKLMTLAFTLGVLIGIIAGATEQTDLGFNGWEMVIISVLTQVLFFWRVNVHLSFINE